MIHLAPGLNGLTVLPPLLLILVLAFAAAQVITSPEEDSILDRIEQKLDRLIHPDRKDHP